MLERILKSTVLSIVLAAGGMASPAMAQTFYEAQGMEIYGQPGTIIHSEQMPGSPPGSVAYRALYRSVGLRGEPIVVSGVIVVPNGRAAAGGRPIVAWAHGTTGIARKCAPSLRPSVFQKIHGLQQMLARGYVVTATDYPGLGTAGPHPYLVGLSEGRAVLDSVRAARALKAAGASNTYGLWGHSQGGHAVLFAGELARSYAPELRLVGVAAAAPATELGKLLKAELGGITGKILGAYALRSWSEVFGISLAGVVLERSMLVFDRVSDFCNETYRQDFSLLFAEQPLEREGFLAIEIEATEPWSRLMIENTPGRAAPGAPVFLAQGTNDPIVLPRVTANFMQGLCSRGAAVSFVSIPGGDHDASAEYGARPAVSWMASRFARQPAPSDCGR